MAEPVITMKYNSAASETPTWVSVASGDYIYFTGPDSVDGTMDPITRPVAGLRIADEMWIETSGVDVNVPQYDAGGQEVADFVTDIFTANPTNTNVLAIQADTNSETSAGILRMWDDNTYEAINPPVKESIAGTTGFLHSFYRAIQTGSNVTAASGAGTAPAAAYQNQIGTLTTYQLRGDTYELQFTTAINASTNQNRFVIHMAVPYNAANPAVAARTVELTYHYFYT